MNYISMRAANNLYIFAKHGTIQRHKADHPAFFAFCKALTRLEHILGENYRDDFWLDFLRGIKNYRFLISAAPLPLNIQGEKLLTSVQEKLRHCFTLYPNLAPHTQDLTDKLATLLELPDNPLIDRITELISDRDLVALLLKEAYLFPLVEEILALYPELANIELVDKQQLRNADCYQQLFIIGPSRWYPEYVLRAPRAKEIHLIRYSWIIDKWKPEPFFLKPLISHAPDIFTKDLNVEEDETENEFRYNDQDILPEINWKHISTRILKQAHDDNVIEYIPARLYLLANQKAVFLDTDESTKVLVLDLEEDDDSEDDAGSQAIKYIPITKLLPGMFLLLRTEGGGDYIVSIADKILQENAPVLRAKQADWKARLRRVVESKGNDGMLAVSLELLDLGSERANETNVRNWMSSRSIRPRDDRDFQAILKLVGLQDKEREYLEAAQQIESAHRKAGFYIRKKLLNQVENANLQELQRQGFMDFELPQADGGSITALRLEHIAPENFNVPASRIGRPVTIMELDWYK